MKDLKKEIQQLVSECESESQRLGKAEQRLITCIVNAATSGRKVNAKGDVLCSSWNKWIDFSEEKKNMATVLRTIVTETEERLSQASNLVTTTVKSRIWGYSLSWRQIYGYGKLVPGGRRICMEAVETLQLQGGSSWATAEEFSTREEDLIFLLDLVLSLPDLLQAIQTINSSHSDRLMNEVCRLGGGTSSTAKPATEEKLK